LNAVISSTVIDFLADFKTVRMKYGLPCRVSGNGSTRRVDFAIEVS